MLFKRNTYYIKIYFNKIEVRNIETGITISKTAEYDFSVPRSIIADFRALEYTLSSIRQEFNKSKFGSIAFKAVVQVVDENLKDVTEVEKRAIIDSVENSGGVVVEFYDGNNHLEDMEVKKILNKK